MTAPTAEDSRALLATYRVSQVSNTYEYFTHLRAALDREAALIAERDAARAEAEKLRAATVAEAVAVIEALATEWPHGWVPSHEAMSRIYALASEPSQ